MAEWKAKPAIRFAGFTDAWEQRKLGEVTKSYSGGTPSVGRAEYYGGSIPFIRSAEINSDTTALFITVSGLNSSSAKMVNVGDILYALYGATSGEVGISRIYGAINQAILAINPESEYDSQFLMQWLRHEKQNIIMTFLQGGQGNLSGAIVKDLLIKFPPTYEEQKKIGLFFAVIDHLITLHQREYAKTVSMKKALLEKMFPKNGYNKPDIRFNGFTDAWEQRKAIDIAPLQRGFDLPKNNMKDGEYPVVMSNGINGYHSEFKAKAPGVVTGRSGTIGKLHYIGENFWPHNTSLWVTDFKGNVPLYVYYMYQLLDLSQYGTGSGVPTLNRNDVHDAKIYIPRPEEQTKISEFFRSIDNLITLHQRELNKLQNMKKALLEKMFV